MSKLKFSFGIIGYATDVTITDCYNTNAVSASYSGGIVGYVMNAAISNCYNGGNVSGTYSGGIVGYGNGTLSISNCYNQNTVSATWSGGLIGYNDGTLSIQNSYNTGAASSGGIAGYSSAGTVSIINCYNIGTTNHALLGSGGATVTNSYYLNTCSQNNTNGGNSRTEAFMKSAEFITLLGAAFKQDMVPFQNNGFPVFTNSSFALETQPAVDITQTTVKISAALTSNGMVTILQQGFQYKEATASNYTFAVVYFPGDTFNTILTGLKAGTNYTCRAFVVTQSDTVYGSSQVFTTLHFNVNQQGEYLIRNISDLLSLADLVSSGNSFSGKTFVLANDIILPNTPNNIRSIGIYSENPPISLPFSGTFNGNGFQIENVYIDQPNTPYQGFFGYTKNASLYEVALVNITASGRNYTGGMVAYAENTYIRDSYISGGTLFALSYCGGLVGYQSAGNNSIISGCYNTCTVTGNNYVGGLLGYSNEGTVRNSYAAALITGQGTGIGAIIGGATDVLSYNCYFNSSVTGQTVAIGENIITKSMRGKIRKSEEGNLSSEEMRMQTFVNTLNQGLTTPVWRMDYSIPVNNGFPILIWQRSNGSCEPPVNLHIVEVKETEVSLGWQGATDGYFVIEYTKVAGGSPQTQIVPATTITLTGLEKETQYSWKVRNVCNVGESDFELGTNFATVIAPEMFHVTLTANNPNMGTVTGEGDYAANSSATIAAIPNQGYRFIQWNDGNIENPRTITVTQDTSFIATFDVVAQGIYRVTVLSGDQARGIVTGSGDYAANSSTTIGAIAYAGYRFAQWNDGNADNPRTITVTQDITYTAMFEVETGLLDRKTSTITVYSNPATDKITVVLPDNVLHAVFTLYDMQGKVLVRRAIGNNDEVSVDNLAVGIYIYNVTTDKERHTGKIIRK
jgi:hypothetical protein